MHPSHCLTLVAALAIAQQAHAQCTAALSWTPPTQYTDGSPILAGDLSGFNVYVDGTRTGSANPTVNGSASTYTVTGLPTNGASHAFRVTALGKTGAESAMSNTATKSCADTRVPKAPTLIDVVIAFLRRLFSHFA